MFTSYLEPICINGMHAIYINVIKTKIKKKCSYKYNNKEYSIMGSERWGKYLIKICKHN